MEVDFENCHCFYKLHEQNMAKQMHVLSKLGLSATLIWI